jgi:hypothetical protein
MQQADPPVLEVVGREDRDALGLAGFRDRGPKRVDTAVGKEPRLGIAEAAVRERQFERVGSTRLFACPAVSAPSQALDDERAAGRRPLVPRVPLGRGVAATGSSSERSWERER